MNILNAFSLKGKTAIVTGCNRGIGKGMALAMAEAGAHVIGVSATMKLSGSEIEQEITAMGGTFKAYQADFSDRASVYNFIAAVRKNEAPIDILINNAGTIMRAPAAEHSDEYWDRVIEINLNSQFVLAREFGADMLKRGKGKIIFTASLLTFQGGITVPGYAASKGAIGSLVKALSNEWAGKGVCVNAIAPGYIATDNTTALRENPERNTAILARIPIDRWGTPDDFKGPAVFLASAASDYVSGEVLLVDGGWMGR